MLVWASGPDQMAPPSPPPGDLEKFTSYGSELGAAGFSELDAAGFLELGASGKTFVYLPHSQSSYHKNRTTFHENRASPAFFFFFPDLVLPLVECLALPWPLEVR